MQPGDHAADGDQGRGGQERGAHAPADERDRERDREGRDRVVARERGLIGARDEEDGVVRVRDERPRPLPEAG